MRINSPLIKDLLKRQDLKITVLSSIVGKYVYFEVPYEGEMAAEELETESGEVMYFKTEHDAWDKINEIKSDTKLIK